MRFSPIRLTGISVLIALTLVAESFTPATTPTLFAANTTSVSGLHVSGNKIFNDAGQALLLHGVNRSSAEYMCIDGSAIFEGPANATEVQAMVSWNINV